MEEIYDVAPKVAHQKVREITDKYKCRNGKHGCIIDESCNIVMETKDILERWGKYIKELYDDPKRTSIPISFEGDLSDPEILELEIEQAAKQLKVGKATGPDIINCEMLRNLGKDGVGVGCKHNINNIRYADDTVLLAHTEEDLQTLLNELDIRSKHFGMEINNKKTELMIFTKKVYSDAPKCNDFHQKGV